MTIGKQALNMKINNNEGLLPWDDGYMPYSHEEHLWIRNLALALLFDAEEAPQPPEGGVDV